MSEKTANRGVQPNDRVIGLYSDLDGSKATRFADDAVMARQMMYDEADGYEVVGVIDANTTEEELQEMEDRLVASRASALMPDEDDPIWEALAKSVYWTMFSWKNRRYLITPMEELEAFEHDYIRIEAEEGLDAAEEWAKAYVYAHGGPLYEED